MSVTPLHSTNSGIKAIVFDFDGVILESVDLKAKVFATLFKDHPRHIDDIVKLHLDNGAMSRYDKFRIIYRDFLKSPLSDEDLTSLGEAFSTLVYEEIFRCPSVQGAERFLEWQSGVCELFVASGTPEEEIRDIVKQRGLGRFFISVYGSPRSKAEILRIIMKERDLEPRAVVFIGDAMGDYRGARDASVHFIGRLLPGRGNPFPPEGVTALVHDLDDLADRWPEIEDAASRR